MLLFILGLIYSESLVRRVVTSEEACHSVFHVVLDSVYDIFCVSRALHSVCYSAHHSVFHTKSQCVSYCSL